MTTLSFRKTGRHVERGVVEEVAVELVAHGLADLLVEAGFHVGADPIAEFLLAVGAELAEQLLVQVGQDEALYFLDLQLESGLFASVLLEPIGVGQLGFAQADQADRG